MSIGLYSARSNEQSNAASALSIDTNDPITTGIYDGVGNNMRITTELLRSPLQKCNGKVQCYIVRDGPRLHMHIEDNIYGAGTLYTRNDSSLLITAVKQSSFFTAGYDIYADVATTEHIAKVECGFGRSMFQIIYSEPRETKVGISSPALNDAENGGRGWFRQAVSPVGSPTKTAARSMQAGRVVPSVTSSIGSSSKRSNSSSSSSSSASASSSLSGGSSSGNNNGSGVGGGGGIDSGSVCDNNNSPISEASLEELEIGSSAANTSRSGVTSTSHSTISSLGEGSAYGNIHTVLRNNNNNNNTTTSGATATTIATPAGGTVAGGKSAASVVSGRTSSHISDSDNSSGGVEGVPISPGRIGVMGCIAYRRPRGDRAISGPRLMDVNLNIVELEQANTAWEYKLVNKPAEWNPRKCCYALPFHGRATIASTKNFQLVHPADANNVILLFGRLGVDKFSLDFQWPLSPLQAFAIACSAFEAFK